MRERRGLDVELLRRRDELQALGDQARRQTLQAELQAARQHGDRQLLRVGGREQEFDVRRRLLERLQQRVEGMIRQHVHLVDEVHLVAPARRRVLDVVEQLAGVVDLGARGRIDLDEIDEAALVDLAAGRADAAGIRAHAALAVQGFREDARDGGLADAARAGEQERMMNLAAVEGVGERTQHVLLPHHLREALRPPFSRQYDIAHRTSLAVTGKGGGPRQQVFGARLKAATAAPFRA